MSQSHMSQSPKIEKMNEIKGSDCPSDFLTHNLHYSEFVELTLITLNVPLGVNPRKSQIHVVK